MNEVLGESPVTERRSATKPPVDRVCGDAVNQSHGQIAGEYGDFGWVGVNSCLRRLRR